MRVPLAAIRVLTIFITIFIYLAHMCCVWVVVRDRWTRVRWSNKLLGYYARWALWVLGLKVNPIGLENLAGLRGGLFVGNHLTYMDVLAISSNVPSCFVT